MRRLTGFWMMAIALLLAGCGGGGVGGGGGGGGEAILQGRVVLVGTGTAPNPPATVIAGNVSVTTDPQNGSFRFGVDPATRTLIVRTPGLQEDFTFNLPPLASGTTTDLGDLYVGPQKVAVQGRVVNALTQEAVGEAQITLLGQSTLSNTTDGKFTLNDIAYDPNGALDSEGTIQKEGFLPQRFLVDQPPSVEGIIQLGDLLIIPVIDENPPPAPGNVRGRVAVPSPETPQFTRIDIYTPPNALEAYESVIVSNTDGGFALWLLPGQYRLEFTKGTRRATRNITVQSLQSTLDLGIINLQ